LQIDDELELRRLLDRQVGGLAHIRMNGQAAWVIGMERVELLRKDGKTMSFDAFVTNVFENKGGQWLLVAHQATPVFKPPE
jgi:ketosteroid isomerase-like protein